MKGILQMEENVDWRSYYRQEPIEPDIYIKFVCFYQAMTELYDRGLTNMRNPYDRTEAYFGGIYREYKRFSDYYSKKMYDCVVVYIIHKTNQPFDIRRWKKQIRQGYSAQYWIDLFEHFRKEKDEIILDMIENIWEYGRIRKDDEHRKHIVIKNPFLETK